MLSRLPLLHKWGVPQKELGKLGYSCSTIIPCSVYPLIWEKTDGYSMGSNYETMSCFPCVYEL